MSKHRKIWEEYYGSIPKDHEGRTYEIHHIDGNRNNNDITNLKCVSIREHFNIHQMQEEFGACAMIMKRMDIPTEKISNIQKGIKRPGIGGVKKGTIPWNKGKKIFVSEELKIKRSKNSTGELNSKSKLKETQVIEILELYFSRPKLESEGMTQRNGRVDSYEWSFSKFYADTYQLTPTALMRLLTKKSWKHVWEKYKI
jgi:hypothetical protein